MNETQICKLVSKIIWNWIFKIPRISPSMILGRTIDATKLIFQILNTIAYSRFKLETTG